MKNKLLMIVAASITLSGCFGMGNKPLTPTQIEYKVVRPEKTYFTCDEVALPDPSTLTDVQVAMLINDLVKANKTCKNNMTAIDQYLKAAEDVLEKRSKN